MAIILCFLRNTAMYHFSYGLLSNMLMTKKIIPILDCLEYATFRLGFVCFSAILIWGCYWIEHFNAVTFMYPLTQFIASFFSDNVDPYNNFSRVCTCTFCYPLPCWPRMYLQFQTAMYLDGWKTEVNVPFKFFSRTRAKINKTCNDRNSML